MSAAKPPICDYEGSDYQQRFWDQGQRAYEDQVEAVALRRLLPGGGERLLELGAGAGRNTPRYQHYQQIVLLDYARSQLALARERLGAEDRYIYVAADIYRLPFAPSVFDGATMIRTLHHMADPLAALRAVRRCLSAGGIFILEYANKRNLKAIARWLLGRQTWNPFDHAPVEFAELNYDFHPTGVEAWLERAAFDLERRLTVSHFRLNLFKRIVPLKLLVAMDSLAQWTGDWWQYSPSVFVRARAQGPAAEPETDAFWACPACDSTELLEGEGGLRCQGCQRLWGFADGIYDFRRPLEGSEA